VTSAVVVLLAFLGSAVAGRLEDARAAYEKGDYVEALRILQPQAEQGDVLAQLV